MTYKDKYDYWLNGEIFDKETKEELYSIKDDNNEIKERFYKDLEFGTGGLRGKMGAGSNRVNTYTVGKATQGFANYILKASSGINSVAIAYDSRNNSREFADTAALVLCANGIKAFVFEDLRSTPQLSFAVRYLKCIAGIVITASHNPPEYNGYKIYWEDGGQVTPPRDKEIMLEVNNVRDYSRIKQIEKAYAREAGLYNLIGGEIDTEYYKAVLGQVLDKDVIKRMRGDFAVIYTPLHGTGNIPVRTVLERAGFLHTYVVPGQEMPDGNFPTVEYPNPEDPKVFALAKELGVEKDADIIIATDPDTDRVGVVVKHNGDYKSLTGNMAGVLLAEYILKKMSENNAIPDNGAVLKTIVTTNMVEAVCDDYGVDVIAVLTGFKYIGGKIKEFEESKSREYIFGLEESYGYLKGAYVRDKDGVASTLLLCEMAAFYKEKGLTLIDALDLLYDKYGFYMDGVDTITLDGIEGAKTIAFVMKMLREEQMAEVGGLKVKIVEDYEGGFSLGTKGEVRKLGYPQANVIKFILENDSWVCVRPSGTEPKLKYYFGVKGETKKEAEGLFDTLKRDMDKILNRLIAENKPSDR